MVANVHDEWRGRKRPMLVPGAKAEKVPARGVDMVRLVDAASEEFNARGVAGASIARIAQRLGLTRAAIYYYVKDRKSLAAQCFRYACARMAADLGGASSCKTAGLERLLYFVRLVMNPDRAPAAAISVLDVLEPKVRAEIAA